MTVHDLTVVRFPELCDAPTLAYPGLIRRAVAEGAWVHTPSSFVADEVVAEFGVDPDTGAGRAPRGARSCPCRRRTGRDRAADSRASRAARRDADRYVLAIGTVEPRKDYPLLVRGLRRGGRRPPGRGAGDRGGRRLGRAAVRRRARTRRPSGTGSCGPGYLDGAALAATLRGAAVLAYPSRYEGFGFPPLQAMAAGVPVVATAAGAVPEVVGDGAWLVPPATGTPWPTGWSRALDGGAEVEALVARGRIRAADVHLGRAAPPDCADLYRDAVATSSDGRRAGEPPAGSSSWPSSCVGRPPAASAPTSSACSRDSTRWPPPTRPTHPNSTLTASRRPGARPDPLAALGHQLRTSPLPGPLLTRAWDHGLVRAPSGFDVVHAVSLATLEPGDAPLVVTVHDLLWRRIPDAYPARGRRWHEAALRAGAAAGRPLRGARRRRRRTTWWRPVRPPDAITVIPMGSDHLPPPDAGRRRGPPGLARGATAVPAVRGHPGAPQEPAATRRGLRDRPGRSCPSRGRW